MADCFTTLSRRILHALTICCVLVLVLPSARAQRGKGEAQVAAVLTSGIVKLGGTVTLIVEVDDAEDARLLSLPTVEGLTIAQRGRPSRQEYTRYINGRMYRRTTLKWEFEVRPESIGEYVFPALQLNVDGKDVETEQELVLKVVKDMRGEDLGFFEMDGVPERIYEGQPFQIDLRFGWDENFPISSAGLFIPWWGQMPGTLSIEEAPGGQGIRLLDLTVNRRHKVAVEKLGLVERGESTYQDLRLSRRFMATRPGTLDLPSSSFEFAKLLQRGGFGRADRYEEYYVLLPGTAIEVVPVPEKGRPFEWTGAVGVIAASRRVDRRDVDAGESIKLTVSWSGDANLEFFEAPDPGRMDDFMGFRVLGREDEYRPGTRRVTYDLVPVSAEVTEIPSVDLWVFDTESEEYRRVPTETVPIRVRQLEDGGGLTIEEEGPRRAYDIRDIRVASNEEPTVELPALTGRQLGGGGIGLVLLWMIARRQFRKERDPSSPGERAKRRARRKLARSLRKCSGARDEILALSTFLAARTGEVPEAWVGRDSRLWAKAKGGIDEDAAQALWSAHDQLDREVYAGSNAGLGATVILALADRMMKGGL
ncbi:MAG: hypothetical protein ACI841_000208 [Planctomycetota bacterium]|jgi:hypothetical protein